MFYIVIGIVLLLLSAEPLLSWFCLKSGIVGQETSTGKRLPKKPYSKSISCCDPETYESSGTLQGMLTLLVEQCPKENGRAKAALDYLEHSRYRDYETALAYLSDSSAVCEKQIREVLKREIQKTTALTCH